MAQWTVRWSEPLPATPYVLLNERGIELPLAAEACEWDTGRGVLLDAGAALNRPEFYQPDILPRGRVWHYTQALDAERLEAHGSRASYVCGDLRRLECRDGAFDRVVCVSTLEHVGFDNKEYGGSGEDDSGSWRLALAEIWRVLTPGGRCFLSVPAGQQPMIAASRRYRAFSVSELDEMDRIVGAPGDRRYFRADPVGHWYDADELPLSGLEPPQQKQRVLGLACLKWVKPCAS